MHMAVPVKATGLPAATPITLDVSVSVKAEELAFRSRSFFFSGLDESLDISRDAAVGTGSYQGIRRQYLSELAVVFLRSKY